ncbi:MAG: M20/M25/M40 family metallo-hydrolase [Synergistetes bacterium]|nr:M20/M25/M40 family metallo-hydrolase [Synergistota bacterium]
MNPVELLYEMVRIKSYTGEEKELAEFLLDIVNDLNFDKAYIDEAGNFVATRGEGAKKIYLVGHMDTVPGWIEPRLEGDYIYGRGSVDAKGALAAFIVAVSEAELPPDLKVVVIGAVEEEGSSKGAFHLLESLETPSYLIVGEPSGADGITLGYKGSLFIRKKFISEVSHSASGEKSAINKGLETLFEIKTLIEEMNLGRERAWERIDMSVREVNSTSDGLTEVFKVAISFRLPLWIKPKELLRALGDGWSSSFMAPAYKVDRSTFLVSIFNRAIKGIGLKPKFKVKSGTSDMNVLAPAWKCPAVAYGPGDSSLDHTPRERLSVREYLVSVKVLKEVLRSIPPTL